jgi:hypothetical protein
VWGLQRGFEQHWAHGRDGFVGGGGHGVGVWGHSFGRGRGWEWPPPISFELHQFRIASLFARAVGGDSVKYSCVKICCWSQIEYLVRVEGLSQIGSKLENLFFRRLSSSFSKTSRARKMAHSRPSTGFSFLPLEWGYSTRRQ